MIHIADNPITEGLGWQFGSSRAPNHGSPCLPCMYSLLDKPLCSTSWMSENSSGRALRSSGPNPACSCCQDKQNSQLDRESNQHIKLRKQAIACMLGWLEERLKQNFANDKYREDFAKMHENLKRQLTPSKESDI